MQRGQIVYCRNPRCGIGWAVTGALPDVCPECALSPAKWTTVVPFRLNENDRRFLRSIRIDPEDRPAKEDSASPELP